MKICPKCTGITTSISRHLKQLLTVSELNHSSKFPSYEVINVAMNVIFFICNTVNYSRKKNTNSLVCHFQSLIHNFSCKRRLVIAPRIKVSKIKKGLKTTTKACQRCLRPAIIIKSFLLLDFSTKLALRIEVVQGQFDPLVPLS